jgi:SAM-dependent methyltransferase
MIDPLARTPWSAPTTVDGFVASPPNQTLLSFAARERAAGATTALDIGCGAGRNLIPLAGQGWTMLGTDLSWPMASAAQNRVRADAALHAAVVLAPMERLPVASRRVDLVIAHGIWNLAQSTAQFRAAVHEAARVARPGAALFVFTFSRHTIAAAAEPVVGERFVYTQFSGTPQIFLTDGELVAEMAAAGFVPEPTVPLTEHNRPKPNEIRSGPVILEAGFRRR